MTEDRMRPDWAGVVQLCSTLLLMILKRRTVNDTDVVGGENDFLSKRDLQEAYIFM